MKKLPKKSHEIKKKFKKISKKNPQKNPKIFQKIQEYHKILKILKVSNSLHRTWRLKTLSGLFSIETG